MERLVKRTYLVSLLSIGWFCTILLSAVQQNQSTQEVAFAFSNVARTKLLSVDTPTNSGALTKAIFPGGFVLSTKFLGEQKRASDWNGRQIAQDFDKGAGALFQIEGGKAPAREQLYFGEGCLLVTESFFHGRKMLTVKHDLSAQISRDLIRRVEGVKGKKAAWGKSIAEIGAVRQLFLVQFDADEKSCLASLVLVEPDSLSFDDYEAQYDDHTKGYVWRVDTPGIDPASFHVLAAFDRKDGIEVAVLWDGYEGQNLYLLRREGATLSHLFNAYRYWAPI
jgi:hypothetical protein